MNVLELLACTPETRDVLERFQGAFVPTLQAFLAQQADQAATGLPPLAERTLSGFLSDFSLRGEAKRLRPLLLCCGYLALGGQDAAAALQASVSVELLQSALLIHDDIIDRSRQRRSGKTMHRLWEDYFEQRGYRGRYPDDRSHFGASMGLLLGDLACALAYEALLQPSFPRERQLAAVRAFTEVIRRVAFGELLEVDLGMKPLSQVSEAEVLKVYELKTSCYTTEGPLHIGAVLAGGTAQQRRLLSDYALPLGIAFQLQDDVLGMFGRQAETGKDEGGDLAEGKRTLLLLKAWQARRDRPEQPLDQALSQPWQAARFIPQVREILVETGALRECLELVDRHLAQVERALDGIEREFGPTARAALQRIASSIEQRRDYRRAITDYA